MAQSSAVIRIQDRKMFGTGRKTTTCKRKQDYRYIKAPCNCGILDFKDSFSSASRFVPFGKNYSLTMAYAFQDGVDVFPCLADMAFVLSVSTHTVETCNRELLLYECSTLGTTQRFRMTDTHQRIHFGNVPFPWYTTAVNQKLAKIPLDFTSA
ncbi:hypothetical protein CLF_112765, partial [Clonorchis sinensis]